MYQFQANEAEAEIEFIWEKASHQLIQTSIELTFEAFSCITFDQSTFWVSLLPDNADRLTKMHGVIAGRLNQPINARYDPHMTLINTKDALYESWVNQLSKIYTPIQDVFVLALGKSDDRGQLTEVMYSFQ